MGKIIANTGNLSKSFIGTTQIKKIYLGNNLLYSSKPKLNAPVINWYNQSAGSIYWYRITNAQSYKIYVDGVYSETITDSRYTIIFNIPEREPYLGTHIIQVQAYTSSSTIDPSDLSNSITYTKKKKLSTPSLSINGSVISWDSISGMSSGMTYDIYINGTLEDGVAYNITSRDLARYSIQNGDTVYIIANAHSSSEYESSDQSNTVTYGQGGTITFTLQYSTWGHGQEDIGPYDITVYDSNGNYLNSFGPRDNEISITVDLSNNSYIIIEGPIYGDLSKECTINVWGGSFGDQYSSGPGDGYVDLSYNISSSDNGVTMYVDYYCQDY